MLGTDQLTLRDLWVIVRHAPRDSALTALIVGLWWAKTTDAPKGRNRPDPVLRPGQTPPRMPLRGTVLPLDQMADILGIDLTT